MWQYLAAAAALVACSLWLLSPPGGAAESRPTAPRTKPSPVQERTPDGTAYAILSPLAKGPAPTLLLFAMAGEPTLAGQPYGRLGVLLHGQGWNVVSLDLPCHGSQLRKGEPAELAGWAARTKGGENIAADLCARVAKVLDHLVKSQVTDPDRIAAAGTSRGGFMAFHVAAADPRIRAAAGFAPVTDLLVLTEFAGLKGDALARQLGLTNVAEKLAGRAAWITIGDQDQRVGTDSARTFAAALKNAAARQRLPARVDLQVLPVPGHTSLPEWHDQAAAWLLALPTLTPASAAAQQKNAPATSNQAKGAQPPS